MRLVQLLHKADGRHLAVVENDALRLLKTYRTAYEAAQQALGNGARLTDVLSADLSDTLLDYVSVYNSSPSGNNAWSILPPFDYPEEPARCLISGTGLTHSKGAANRDAMHQTDKPSAPNKAEAALVTDSMRIYQWGVEGGKPDADAIGVQPEWFYKGNGTILRGHNAPLDVPDFAEDGGEEPEAAGIYLIDGEGQPRRLGFATGNEFSDHVMERRNYLYLAPSKLRTCALGPELALDADFDDVRGTVTIERHGETIWSHPVATGETNMVHSLVNLEHHHFKYPAHRRPGDVHIHFFGTGAFSFGAGVHLADGDVMVIDLPVYGRPLRNPIRIASALPQLATVLPL